MTDRVDFEAIKARANAATAEPWTAEPVDYEDGYPGHSVLGGGVRGSMEEHQVCWVGTPTNRNLTADAEFIAHAREDVPALIAELAVLRAQRDATLAACDAAVAEYDKAAAEATTRDADSPAAAARRGLAGGAFLMATAVRAALGVQPEPDNG